MDNKTKEQRKEQIHLEQHLTITEALSRMAKALTLISEALNKTEERLEKLEKVNT